MRLKRVLIIPLLFVVVSAYAQRNEFGVYLGGSYYIGDLNPSTHFGMIQPAGGLLYRYNFNPRWTFKTTGLYGIIRGDDAITSDNATRNLHFKSHIVELSMQLELNFLPYFTGGKKHGFSPYIFAGISVFNYNPKALFENKWYELQPLGTEGQTTSVYPEKSLYKLTQFSFPFGLGLKISVSNSVCIGMEWGMRKTMTDYLDDVSTIYVDKDLLSFENDPIAALLSDRSDIEHEPGTERGNSLTKDWYSFAGVTVTFVIFGQGDKSCPAFRKFINYNDFLYVK